MIFRRKALVAIREEASEFEHHISSGGSHVDDIGVDGHVIPPPGAGFERRCRVRAGFK